jgi:hypothetical protein
MTEDPLHILAVDKRHDRLCLPALVGRIEGSHFVSLMKQSLSRPLLELVAALPRGRSRSRGDRLQGPH